MTQEEMILNHLQKYGKIDPMTAITEYGIMRLASRICDIRRKGTKIKAVTVRNPRTGAHWSEYHYEVS